MSIEITSLPNDSDKLKNLLLKTITEKETEQKLRIETLKKEHQAEKENLEKMLRAEIKRLKYEMELFKLRFFAPHSEKLKINTGQMELFNEAEQTASKAVKTEETEEIKYTRRKRGKRKKIDLSRYPSVDIVHDLSDEEKIHSCGQQMKEIGAEETYKLRVIPKQLLIEKHIRKKYACPCQGVDTEGKEGAIRIAPVPAQMIEKSIATPSLLADVIVSKFCDSLPFYRQEKILNRYGIEISRETLSRWAIQVSEKLEVLRDQMESDLLGWEILGMDETPVQVLSEKDRKNETKSYMWVARGGPPGKPVILYQYRRTREGRFVRDFLKNWRGTVVCDGYKGYNSGSQNLPIRLAGCWAHARRRFIEVVKAAKGEGNAGTAVEYIRQLYKVEKEAREKELDFNQIKELRQKQSRPVIEEFRKWLDVKAGESPPKSPLGRAVRYTLGEWEKLVVYLEDGRVPIDNNLTENAIRPFVIGKKNWLFSACPSGARASAFLYSLLETAKANGLEPYWYLNYLFEKFPLSKGNDYSSLLPYNLTPEEVALYLKVNKSFTTYTIPVRK